MLKKLIIPMLMMMKKKIQAVTQKLITVCNMFANKSAKIQLILKILLRAESVIVVLALNFLITIAILVIIHLRLLLNLHIIKLNVEY